MHRVHMLTMVVAIVAAGWVDAGMCYIGIWYSLMRGRLLRSVIV